MPVSGRKIIIIGGAGFVGSAVAHQLANDGGADVIICDQIGSVQSGKWANLPAKLADLWAPDDLMGHLDKAWREIAGVLIFADAGHDGGDGDGLLATSYHLPRRVWDYAVAKQRPIHWASSLQVYGTSAPDRRYDGPAVANFKPTTAFGRVKQAFDYFAASQGLGPDAPPRATGFRLASVYGAGEGHKGELASLPTRAIAHAQAGKTLAVWELERGQQPARDWVHVDDAATAISQLILSDHAGFFDIGTGQLTQTHQLLTACASLAGAEVKVRPILPPPGAWTQNGPAADLSWLEQTGLSCQFRQMEAGLIPA
ncbi:ADP-L-glycero-D-manno-heptose-6-epimerase [Candidatus Phycosocius bacilliformis]|uniref:ADP-L-glycero-D-manno-heptose-6-epimerase n=1 Tax=Candidatus Phycosocius bacilliformis TaxID=1445552 RepID=A0A2P2E9A3_9PROT|nr:NAD-dependent epimerase/dehydratase family protein [Candidatus Phycosocius bacilliformis]GBF57633.1 ADP-L-glycero-D-manno-heptose-6-epimerase [Candidatus Phycosocius bacilliformis]